MMNLTIFKRLLLLLILILFNSCISSNFVVHGPQLQKESYYPNKIKIDLIDRGFGAHRWVNWEIVIAEPPKKEKNGNKEN